MGLLLLRNTKYNPKDFLKALDLSLVYDTIAPADLDVEIYKQIFDLPDQPFKERWLEKEDFSKYDYVFEERFSEDSLSSHPEISDRIERLRNSLAYEIQPEDSLETMTMDEDAMYQALRSVAKKEEVPNLYLLKQYGFCIYLSLMRIEQDFEAEYHKKWMGKAFKALYKARKAYTANKYLDRIDPEDQSESYQQFINFMWNLRLEEIKNIADFYSNGD